jgi:hypothetical protein
MMTSEPFTPELVRGLIMKTASPNSRRPPDDGIRHLTGILNQLQMMATYRRDTEVNRALANFALARRIMTEAAPSVRTVFVAEVEAAERRASSPIGAPDPAIPRSYLETFDALVAAVEAAKELPLCPYALVFGIERWKGYAQSLAIAYDGFCTEGTKEAAYRFIAEATPRITGEEPTPGAVEIWIKRQVQTKT